MVDRLAWIVAVTLGLVAGGFVFHFPGSYGEPAWSVVAGIFGFVLGAVNGALVGVLAWMALRLSRRDGVRLLLAMSLLVGGTHALNDGSSSQVPFQVIELGAGLLAAGVVAWILSERRPSTLAIVGIAWTVGIVVGGWTGDQLGLPLTETPLGWAQDHGWDGLITGLVWSIATAATGLPGTLRGEVKAGTSVPEFASE